MRALALIAILAARVSATGSAEDTEVVKDTFEDLVTAVVDADAESLIDGLHSSAHIRTARNLSPTSARPLSHDLGVLDTVHRDARPRDADGGRITLAVVFYGALCEMSSLDLQLTPITAFSRRS